MLIMVGKGQNIELLLFRVILLIGFTAQPLFGYLATANHAGVIEYPSHRLMLSAICLFTFCGSFFSPSIRTHIVTITCWWLFIDHIWVTWIVYVNQFHISYYSGLITSFCALIITIRKPSLFYIFSITSVLATLLAAWACPTPGVDVSMVSFTMVVLGTAFVLTNKDMQVFQKNLLNRNIELEQEVMARAAVAEKRANQLANKNKELEQFAYIASHDLKSPLRNIGGFAQLLQKRLSGQQGGEVNEYIDFIVNGVKKMNHVIEDILLYSRFGEEATKFELVAVGAVVEEAMTALQWEIQERKAILYMDGVEGWMYCDRAQMGQLFQNLLSNAIKYNESARPIIKICMASNMNEFLFSVKDNGIGIPQEYQDRVFKMFQRLHTDKEYSGTGIGLAICQRIVQNHQGKIWIRSIESGGSKFYFTISKNLGKAHPGTVGIGKTAPLATESQ